MRRIGIARRKPRLIISVLCASLAALTSAATATAEDRGSRDHGPSLKRGAVFTMTNAREGNEILAFTRSHDGRLKRAGSFATGGAGSGSFEDSANGLVLGSAQGEASPNNLIRSKSLLFATNAGGDSITTFRVQDDGLVRADVEPSGGEKPVSVTVNNGLVYVLNSGETQDDLFDADGLVIPNCATGNAPSITGFRVGDDGDLTPIPNSTRPLSGLGPSGCAQVSFNPTGNVLVVTERLADDEGPNVPRGDEGVIDTYTVNDDGTLNGPRVTDATGEGPFGFTFNKRGALLTTEQFDGPMGPSKSAAASYQVADDGALTPLGGSVPSHGTDSCWFVVTDNGKFGYVTNFFSGDLTSYRVGRDGGLTLLERKAADGAVDVGASDEALSRKSRFLYHLNSLTGTINAFRVRDDGGLVHVQETAAQGPSPMGAGIGLAAS